MNSEELPMDRPQRTIFCASPLASAQARIEIHQDPKPGWIWIAIFETRDGEERNSEIIKVSLSNLLQTLENFK